MNGNSLRALMRLAIVAACVSTAALAQLPSNASLKGAYYVRYLGEDTRNGGSVLSFSGTMTFDGAGKYTLSGAGNNSKTTLKFNTSGNYSVLSNALVVIDNAFDTSGTTASGPIYGGLGTGLISGSSTEGAYCDLFVAVPAATAGTNATLSGTYNVASLEFLGGSLTATRDTFFPMNADGAGNLGNVTIKGTAQSLGDAATTQTSNGATYTVTANGTGTLNLPAPSGVTAANVLLSGNKVLYAAADGSFFIAGGATTYDLVIGAKAAPGASFNGLYFSAYLQNYATGSSGDAVYAVSGSTNAISSITSLIAHERTNSEISYPYDYTYSDTFQFAANGVSPDSNQALGAGGNIMIAAGTGGNYLLAVYPKSVPMSTTGAPAVFLNPQGVVNAANNVPFTAQVSPGEVVTLYGTGFTTQTLTTPGVPFPNTLGGAQVTITYLDANSKSVSVIAPVYYVSPTQISAVVPFTVPNDGTQLTFTVTNGSASNAVTVYSGPSSPGIFTQPSGGIGSGAVLHADFSLVTAASPAKSGETIQVFLTGVGTVTGNTAAGAAGPTSPLATTVLPVDIGIIGSDGNFYDGTAIFSGLAPGLGGLYQVNVTLPANLPAGTAVLSIYVGDGSGYGDGWNEQATMSVVK
ncbi:MAG TPA: hypothetical protein VNV86_19750 [Candidatus Acidoferrum sp.]|nr:hypothetical protein [Candidatus Acidoferrum sp.]